MSVLLKKVKYLKKNKYLSNPWDACTAICIAIKYE